MTAVQVGLVAAVVAVVQGRSRRKAAARQGTSVLDESVDEVRGGNLRLRGRWGSGC